jgi:hypothetical protein
MSDNYNIFSIEPDGGTQYWQSRVKVVDFKSSFFYFRHDVGFRVYEESIKLVYGRSVVLVRCPLLSEMFYKGLLYSKAGMFSGDLNIGEKEVITYSKYLK